MEHILFTGIVKLIVEEFIFLFKVGNRSLFSDYFGENRYCY